MRNLNLGAGSHNPPGFTAVDLEEATEQCDLSEFPWPFAESSADAILASHILEHMDRPDGVLFLRECRRILKPNAWLYLAVPDMDIFVDCYLRGEGPPHGYPWGLGTLMGGSIESEGRPHWRHQYMYCEASLTWTLEHVGFRHVRRAAFSDLHNPAYAHISLYMEAQR